MCEPRGHKDMVGALLVEPISKEADIGVIYMDANRWINMCGHATIGVSMTLVNENLVKVVEPTCNSFNFRNASWTYSCRCRS